MVRGRLRAEHSPFAAGRRPQSVGAAIHGTFPRFARRLGEQPSTPPPLGQPQLGSSPRLQRRSRFSCRKNALTSYLFISLSLYLFISLSLYLFISLSLYLFASSAQRLIRAVVQIIPAEGGSIFLAPIGGLADRSHENQPMLAP